MKDDTTGKWTTQTLTLDQEKIESLAAGYKDLFKSEFYGEFDKETGRYTMKEGTKVTVNNEELVDAEFYDAYIECGDGEYTVFTKYTAGIANCTLTLKFSEIGKVTVTLPEV